MRQVAAMLQYRFTVQVTRNPKKFKKDAVHYLRLYLPPGPGQLAEDATTKAIELRKQAWGWKQIYPQCISHYANLSPAARRLAEYNLRGACRSRRNTARRRKRRRSSLAQTTPLANVPSRPQPDSALQLGE